MEENRNSAISVRNVCIDYKSLKTGSIKENLFKIKKVEQEIFHAVRNVSFEVPEGQILGITGKNGSGKSTMLRAIAGIFSADSGEIDLHGHTISLLSIGVGFRKREYHFIWYAPWILKRLHYGEDAGNYRICRNWQLY